ncbi:MAG: glycosyltransferase family 4 protein [Myxococcota bacterium]|nr:glycosyltransferase family 4 protein [Myxococcota bacterium]
MSNFHGWGIYGLNLALHWANDPDLLPLFPYGIEESQRMLTPEETQMLAHIVNSSKDLQQRCSEKPTRVLPSKALLLQALGNQLSFAQESADKFEFPEHQGLGVVFLENTKLNAAALERGKRWPLLITGSTWNQALLESYQQAQVKTVFQGVDTKIFYPGPKQDQKRKHFRIFSGGKLEYRKGQDLVLLAFRHFAQRHADAQLITAWQSPWPHLGRALETNPEIAALRFKNDQTVNVEAWAEANDIPGDRVVDLGRVANRDMAEVMRNIDVAIFPNRAEGGTNLVAMECMASGVPVIISENTGHLDLAKPECVFGLKTQGPVSFGDVGTEGWGESSVDEMIAALEKVYQDQDAAWVLGQKAHHMMQDWSWQQQSSILKQTIMPYL